MPLQEPDYVSVINFSGAVLDQGQYGTCAENALSSVLTLQANLAGSPIDAISRAQAYYDNLDLLHKVGTDWGTWLPGLFNNSETKGLTSEARYGYTADHLPPSTQAPGPEAYQDAATHKILSTTTIQFGTAAMTAMAIAAYIDVGKTVMAEFMVHQGFMNEHGTLSWLQSNDVSTQGAYVGVHEIDIMTVDFSHQFYTIKNSWDTTWGDHGYGILPFSAFADYSGRSIPGITAYSINDLLSLDVVNGYNGVDQTVQPVNYGEWGNPLPFDPVGNATGAVTMLYDAILNRIPDLGGLRWWSSILSHGQATVAQIAEAMLTGAESRTVFTDQTNLGLIAGLYHQVFNRAPDAGGAEYWASVLAAHPGSLGDIACSFLTTAADYPYIGKDAEMLREQQWLVNRQTISEYVTIGMQETGNHVDLDHSVLAHITADPNSVEIVKVGLAHDFGIA